MSKLNTPESFIASRDLELPSSEWIEIDQATINAFADVTRDHQFIHVDPERTQRETELPGTIAHGFLTLSLLSYLSEQCLPQVDGATGILNYGMDKLRFLSPVPTDSRIRAHFRLIESRLKDEGQLLIRYGVSVEIEKQQTPALVAEWMAMVLFDKQTS